jgi:4-hydroxybenzoate polyprenyltransferase
LLTASLVAPKLACVLGFYFLLNLAYSVRLKHIPIVDIFFIATGFVLRVFAGAFATNIPPSMWIIIMTFLLALFMALAKRRDDVLLTSQGRATRKNIDGYNLEFVNAAMSVMSAVIIGSYIQYTVSEEVVQRLGTHYLYLTSVFVILGIMRYMQITFVQGASGSPTTIFLKDRFLQLTILLWLLSFFGIVLADGTITAVLH